MRSDRVEFGEDPAEVLDVARDFLATDPVRHNLILTILESRVRYPQPGRYWIVRSAGAVAGVVLQSPVDFLATVTPMAADDVAMAVDAIASAGVALPGVNGSATTVASFAGQWAERTRAPARPVQGQRLYEARQTKLDRVASGHIRPAGADDLELVTAWLDAFAEEAHEARAAAATVAHVRTAAGELWLWDDAGPVSLAGVSRAVAGAVRIGPVYTPRSARGRGYASGLVEGLTRDALERGLRCLLYTDLANPTSNSVYQAIGYQAVDEVLRYHFDPFDNT